MSSTLQFNAILTIKISNWDYWWYHNHSMVRRQKLSLAQLSLPPIKFYWKILLTGNSESLPNQTRGYQLANPTKITTQWNELRKSLNWYMILNRRTWTLIVSGPLTTGTIREGFKKKKKSKTWDIVPSLDTPSPPLNLGHPYVKYFWLDFYGWYMFHCVWFSEICCQKPFWLKLHCCHRLLRK